MRYYTLVTPLLLGLVLGLSAQGQPVILPMPTTPPEPAAPPEAAPPAPQAPVQPPSPEAGPAQGPRVLPQIAPQPDAPITAPLTDPAAPVAPQSPPADLPFGQGSAFGTQQPAAPLPPPSPEALVADPLRIAELAGRVGALLGYALDWPQDLGVAAQSALDLASPPVTLQGEGWEQVVLQDGLASLSGGCQRVTGRLMAALRDKGALDEARSWEGYAPEVVAAITRGGFLYDMPPEATEGVSCAFDLGPTALALGPQGLELQAMAEAFRARFDPVDLRGVAADTGIASPFGELPKAIGRDLREGDSKVLQASVMAVAGRSASDPYHWRLEIALWRRAP